MTHIDCADLAARFHADMCDDERNGYSWSPRWGGDHPDRCKTLVIDGLEYSYPLGSYDCSSSFITAWRLALKYTKYAGALDGASSTYDIRQVFQDSGLFYTDPSNAKRGDGYLKDDAHVAMCQDGGNDSVFGYDALSEFSINEFGGCYGGEVGDQTGNESSIHGYYDYGNWGNEVLHYNGNADCDTDQPSQSDDSSHTYAAYTKEDGWLNDMHGTTCTCNAFDCSDDFAGIEGHWIYGLRANFPFCVVLMDGSETDYVTEWYSETQAMRGLKIQGDVQYQVHTTGNGWLKIEHGTDDDGAGDDIYAVDLVRVW